MTINETRGIGCVAAWEAPEPNGGAPRQAFGSVR
jgi:hypothetical protein